MKFRLMADHYIGMRLALAGEIYTPETLKHPDGKPWLPSSQMEPVDAEAQSLYKKTFLDGVYSSIDHKLDTRVDGTHRVPDPPIVRPTPAMTGAGGRPVAPPTTSGPGPSPNPLRPADRLAPGEAGPKAPPTTSGPGPSPHPDPVPLGLHGNPNRDGV